MAADLPDVYVRFEGLKGECTDELHPGSEGWVQIKGFSFGFGLKDTGAANKNLRSIGGRGLKPEEQVEQLKQAVKDLQTAQAAPPKPAAPGAARDDGPFDFPEVRLEKSLNLVSSSLWDENAHRGKVIPEVELVACRYGGVGTKSSDIKIPFLRLVFENVRVTKVSLGLSDESLPTESVTFDYDRVGIEYLWTDNETGERLADQPQRAGWDREKQQAWTAK